MQFPELAMTGEPLDPPEVLDPAPGRQWGRKGGPFWGPWDPRNWGNLMKNMVNFNELHGFIVIENGFLLVVAALCDNFTFHIRMVHVNNNLGGFVGGDS
jgi:hypothetical protein